jgi:hypothetical protein
MSDFQEGVGSETEAESTVGPGVALHDSPFGLPGFRGPGGGGIGVTLDALGHWAGDAQVVVLSQRDQMLAEVERRGRVEILELDGKFAAETRDLEQRFMGQLGGLKTEQETHLGELGKQQTAGDAALGGEIDRRTGVHAKQITDEHQAAVDLEKKIETANRGGNVQDTQKVRDQAAGAAEKTRAEAKVQADAVRSQGQKQVALAYKTASAKAAEARQAAALYAQRAPAGDRGQIVAEGEERAKWALTLGNKEAQRIAARTEQEAKNLLAEGDRLARGQLARAEREAKDIAQRGAKAEAAVEHESKRSEAEMKGLSDEAKRAMTAVRSEAAAVQRTLTHDTSHEMDALRGVTALEAEKQKAAARAELQKTYDTQKAEIEKRTQAAAKQVEKAKEEELSAVKKKVDRDLAAMEKLAESADARMKGQVTGADGRLAVEVRETKRKLRLEAQKAKAASETLQADAKRQLAAADSGTKARITEAAKRGAKAVKGAGEAIWQVASENQDGLAKLAELTAADDMALATAAERSQLSVPSGGERVAERIDEFIAERAEETATEAFADGAAALHTLQGLPPDVQGKAVARMTISELNELLADIPEERREDLGPLLANTHDPYRKLTIWGAYHRAEAKAGAKRHGRGDRFAANASGEINEEMVALLQEQQRSGKPLTERQVQDLIDRKELELSLEMKHGFLFTNEGGRRQDGSHIHWKKEELASPDGVLTSIPETHKAENDKFTEMRREDVDTQSGFDASHGADNKIRVFDKAAKLTTDSAKGTRNVGNSRELVGRECPHCGLVITHLDAAVAHEMGHAVHSDEDKHFAAFQKLSGWKQLDAGDLDDAKLTDAEKQSLDDARKNKVGWGARPKIRKNGKIYTIDPYSSDYLVVDDAAIPENGENVLTEKGATNDNAWDYARTSPKEHFAEMYAKAVTVPTQLHRDLVEIPDKMVAEAAVAVAAARDPAARKAAEERLARAQRAKEVRGKQFHLMRDEVFDADAEVDAAQMRLASRGVKGDALRRFRAAADKASTPQQVRAIEESYGR